MKIEINSKELKSFKKILKAEDIKITAKHNYVELYAKANGVELLKKLDEVKIYEIGEVAIQQRLIDMIPNGLVILSEDKISTETINISFENELNKLIYDEITIQEVLISEFDSLKLKEILSVGHAAAKDETRPVLQNIYLEDNDVIALDGYRLALRDTGFAIKQGIKIPKEAVKVLKKIKSENNSIGIQGRYVIFKLDDYFISFENSEDKFINYKSLLKSRDEVVSYIECENKVFLDFLKRAKCLNENIFCLDIIDREVFLEVKSFDISIKERIQVIECSGEIKISLNKKYLIDSMKELEGKVRIEFRGEIKPVIIKQKGKTELVLPIRLAR